MASERRVVHVPVTNVGYSDVWLTPRRIIAAVSMTIVLSEHTPHVEFGSNASSNECTALVSGWSWGQERGGLGYAYF